VSNTSKSSVALSLLSSQVPDSGATATKQTITSDPKSSQSRRSTRLKIIKKEKEDDNILSPARKQLKRVLQKKMLVKESESLVEAFSRFEPRVKIRRLTQYEVFRRTDDWSFLGENQFPDSINFRSEVIASRSIIDEEHGKSVDAVQCLVRYIPKGIIEDQWIFQKDLLPNSVKTVALQSLSWHQKLLIRDKLSA
jgi:hypothetical protein